MVVDGTQDIATSQAIKMQRQRDKDKSRTIGILTKLDKDTSLAAKTHNTKKLLGQEYGLTHGWFGLKCRSKQEIDQGVTIEQNHQLEKQFFQNDDVYGSIDPKRFGIGNLKNMLQNLFFERLIQDKPIVENEIEKKILEF